MVIVKNNSHMLSNTCQVAILWVFKLFLTFVLKVTQTWFILHETWHTELFVIYYCVVVDRIEIKVLCKKLRAKLDLLGF